MITFIFSLALFGVTVAGNTCIYTGVPVKADDLNWKKDPDRAWQGKKEGKTYWYKLDDKGRLLWSEDKKNWDRLGSGIWYDNGGHLLMISENRLMWSGDEGRTWNHVPGSKWQGSDKKWYKFDKNWTLWVAN